MSDAEICPCAIYLVALLLQMHTHVPMHLHAWNTSQDRLYTTQCPA